MKTRKLVFRILLPVLVVSIGLVVVRWRKYDSTIGAHSMAEGEQQFLNGSYRNEEQAGVPYYVYQVLPAVFPELFPAGVNNAFGFVRTPGRELPVGLVKTKYDGIDWITHNCSLCHVASFLPSPDAAPIIVLGAPAGYWREKYLNALEAAFLHYKFTPDNIVAAIKARHPLSPGEEETYRKWVRHLRVRTVQQLKELGGKQANRPSDGPGRMDALLVAKEMAFQVDNDIGTTDYAPLWNRNARVDSMGRMIGHWDGFGQNLLGMVTASMLADGVRPADFQMNQAKTLTYYFANLSAPAYPLAVDQSLVPRGKVVFEARCAECHGSAGAQLNTVVSIHEIKTDPNRLDAARPLLLWTLNLFDFFQRYPASRWRKTNGYRAELLDGVWARAPYLHNGSVPTVYDLLSRAEQRPRTFYRGSNVIDPLKLGIATIAIPGGPAFLFDTSLSGNRNTGHEYGADLPEADKKALIDFLKTL